jgi:hypothetical protein
MFPARSLLQKGVFMLLRKTSAVGILLAIFLLFAACEQPAGTVRNDDATLKTLAVDTGRLSPAFSASHFDYRVTVRNAVETITVTAAANSGKSSVSGAGTKALAGGSGNTITLTVRAENGDSKTYTVTVTRLDSTTVKEITNQNDMAQIGVLPDWPLMGEYKLANDITLANWPPVGDETDPFAGVFDGNGKKITLNSFDETALSDETYIGIFGYVQGDSASEKAKIKNLTIHSAVNAEGTAQAVGLVAGYAELAEIENITLTGTFAYTSATTNYVGGIAGIAAGEGTLVKNSASSLTMNIVPGQSATLITGVLNYSYVGGFAGIISRGPGIENCHYTGNITADNVANSEKSGQVFVGGIIGGSDYILAGDALSPPYYNGYIADSSFNGTLIGRAKGSWVFAGGIAGVICGGRNADIATTTRIVRCYAAGTVSVAGTTSAFPYVGGVVGYNYFGALVSQCYFDGTVIAEKANDYTGGVAGYNSQWGSAAYPDMFTSRIEDCWSSGTVTGFNNAAGIVGQNQVSAYVRRCYSKAAINAANGSASGVGGITGLHTSVMTDAVTACVALNPSITAAAGNNIHRITGSGDGAKSDNYAWSGMTVTTGGAYTEAKGADAADGEDCDEKPNQAFYEDIGWDFVNVWKIGGDGYPQLKWQQ